MSKLRLPDALPRINSRSTVTMSRLTSVCWFCPNGLFGPPRSPRINSSSRGFLIIHGHSTSAFDNFVKGSAPIWRVRGDKE
jgi:hypothetical protein